MSHLIEPNIIIANDNQPTTNGNHNMTYNSNLATTNEAPTTANSNLATTNGNHNMTNNSNLATTNEAPTTTANSNRPTSNGHPPVLGASQTITQGNEAKPVHNQPVVGRVRSF